MHSNKFLVGMIFAMFLATYSVRFLSLLCFNRLQIPETLKTWLSYIPISVFASLVAQVLFEPIGETDWNEKWPLLLSCLGTAAVARKTKSLGWGIGFGFSFFVGLTLLLS